MQNLSYETEFDWHENEPEGRIVLDEGSVQHRE